MKYPHGVKVAFDAVGRDGVREDVVEWRPIRTMGGICAALLFGALTVHLAYGLWENWWLHQLRHVPDHITVCINEAWPLLVPCALSLGVIAGWFACGSATLRLVAGKGIFTLGVGRICRRTEFVLTPETQVRIDCKKEWVRTKGRGRQVWTREIVVIESRNSYTYFGRSLPLGVQEFMCECMRHIGTGRPLVDGGVDTAEPRIPHPILFAICLAGFLLALVGSLSGFERLTVADNVLTISRTSWFGYVSDCIRIPCSEIANVVAANERTRRRDNSWVVEFRNGKGSVLGRTCPLGPHIFKWETRLTTAVRQNAGLPFDDFHLTTLRYAPLTLLPLVVWILFSGICSVSIPADPDDDDRSPPRKFVFSPKKMIRVHSRP